MADPAWPEIQSLMAEAVVDVQVLPAPASRRDVALETLQFTARSFLGALVGECGGLLVDHGWLRILGAGASGQGHRTVFGKLAADLLGLTPDQVELREGDTRFGVMGAGTVASRSAMTVGSAIVRTVEAVIEKGRKVAAQTLEAAEADIDYRDGVFEVTGTDRRLALFDLAERATQMKRRGEASDDLDTNLVTDTPPTYPNGCHIAEVEVDPDTGVAKVLSYTAVDDSGRILDPLIVEGQVQGGLAQGLGQALMEHGVYDRDSGQLLAGSFMDYAMPRADDMPALTEAFVEVPATTNPLGVKGVGEAGTIASTPAIINAVVDALRPWGVNDIQMPATPERVWRAIHGSEKSDRAGAGTNAYGGASTSTSDGEGGSL